MAECGTLRVFENRTTNRGRHIDINFIVLRADRQPAREAVFMFAGGPGGGSTSMAGIANGWARPIRDAWDVVLVDQRGTGKSHPLPCPQGSTTDPAAGFGHIYHPERARACRTGLESDADLTQYTTDTAVQDIDDVRTALGYERIVVYGESYGTRVAQAYMRRYPAQTKAAVIDGVAPFDNGLPLTYAASAQQALDRIFEYCQATRDCHARHPSLAADFASLLRRFDAGPVTTTVTPAGAPPAPVVMSRGDFGYAVRGMLYAASAKDTLPDVIGHAAASGDLSAFAQRYFDRQQSFNRTVALGMHWTVECAEDIPYASDADIAAATANTFLGRYIMDEYRGACAQWPRATLAPDFRAPVSVRVPTLLVSGYFDPVTPPEFADRVARSLPLARTVLSPGTAHGSSAACPRAAVLHVFMTGSLDGLPDVCR